MGGSIVPQAERYKEPLFISAILGRPRSRKVAPKTEAVYRRYAIVCEADLTGRLKKLAVQEDSLREKMQPCRFVRDFSHSCGQNTSKYTEKYGGGGEI